jgi:hypothetical protein
MNIWDIITGFLIGIATSVVVDIIVRLLPIGENLRYTLMFNWRKFTKWARNVPINVKYVNKTENLESRNINIETLMKNVEKVLGLNDFTLSGKLGNSIIATRLYGKSEIKLTLSPSYVTVPEEDSETLVVSDIQGEYEITNCRYKEFTGHLIELLQVSFDLQKSMREIVGDWSQDSLTCEISRLYEYTGVFSELKLSSLSGKMAGKYSLTLSEKQMTVYGKLEQALISMVKDVIAFYY